MFDSTNKFHTEALWFSFSGLLQEELEFIKEHWNSHRIRRSRFDTVAGRPDAIYYLPESFGGTSCMQEVAERDMNYACQHLICNEYENEYFLYFQYVMAELLIPFPSTWQEALQLYKSLIEADESGI